MTDEIRRIKRTDSLYPPQLEQISDPPNELYVRGNADLLKHPTMLAVVGSRKADAYGKQAATNLLTPIAQHGIPIISGLAYGIDALSHRICVDNSAQTVAVLGSFIDDASIYPRSHVTLAHRILESNGVLVSEYPEGTPTYPSNFPARNRIIAALAKTTLIVQASEKSGSLITARLALEYNKDVCAVPGNITHPLARGTNKLIQAGAYPILADQDLFDILDVQKKQGEPANEHIPEHQQHILKAVTNTPQHIDDIASAVSVSTQQAAPIILELELANRVIHVGGMKYVKAKK